MILNHDCVSVIVSRITSLIEDFVICCCQVTKLFCSRYHFATASSARSHCHFGSRANFAISVSWEVSVSAVLLGCHFCGAFHSVRFLTRSSEALLLYPFLFLGFWWIVRPVSWCELVTSLWCWTWRCTWWCTWRVLRWRCRGWTRTRIGRQTRDNHRYEIFRFAQNVLPLFGQPWLGPLVGTSVIELQACHRVIALSRRDQDRERVPVLPRLLAPPRRPLPPLWVSISAELKSFLFSTCIDAPQSTTNSSSSRDFEVGASVALASIGQ